ncbi:PhzF family phenazine biosynthesis protein [Gloeocapsa sp. PCC 73106]|uniref:PhzF family phenazine biosynthesis protein n=1 Tax=Gloeocapsa sp. PCC 73106 TaxID=102232 RepID=UPI0002ABE50B|nr:PhzF family phenazine biosynthesis protein [Gloeocapsa sp. PCC 73106]ELR97946.1 phenazine biosynthesis protein PhzF family [Gloeocapsa sp. PCC 73106]
MVLFYTVDVFTNQIFGGNPLAVIPEAKGLTGEQMQRIAKEFNLSETVFVLPPQNPENSYRLRIFTPQTELPFAGHPTLGTAYILSLISPVSSLIFEEGVGPITVAIALENGVPVYTELLSAQMPEYGPSPPEIEELAPVLGLDPQDIGVDNYQPAAVSCGLPFLFVPLRNLNAIARARLNRQLWERVLASYWAPHVYLFTRETLAPEVDIHARMFAPALGIEEDPATGSAAAALGGYLAINNSVLEGKKQWQIEQGIEMGRPSRLRVTTIFSGGQITAIKVGGSSVLVSEGHLIVTNSSAELG